MELKKNNAANNENLRVPIRLMGLLFVSGIVLASFTFKVVTVEDELSQNAESAVNNDILVIEEEPETPEQEEPPEVQATPPPTETSIVEENKPDEIVAAVTPPPPKLPAIVDAPITEAEIIDFPDVEAGFPGGAAELQKWISANVQYPETSIEMEDQGRVFLSFVVEPDGKITNIVVERGVTRELDREAKRVVRKMPKWSAGEASGKKVRTRCRLPIVFTLQ